VWESSKRNHYIFSPRVIVKAIFITSGSPIRPLSLVHNVSLHPMDIPAVITTWISVSTTVYYRIDLPLVYSSVPDCSDYPVRNFRLNWDPFLGIIDSEFVHACKERWTWRNLAREEIINHHKFCKMEHHCILYKCYSIQCAVCRCMQCICCTIQRTYTYICVLGDVSARFVFTISIFVSSTMV